MSDEEPDEDRSRKEASGRRLDAVLSSELQSRRNKYLVTESPRTPKRIRRGIIVLMMVLIGFLIVFSGPHLLAMASSVSSCGGASSGNASSTGRPSVALVDQVGALYPNPAFVDNVSASARSAGYSFDYYPARTATVGFFATLPARGYSIVILRTHGTGLIPTDPSAIVTSENYSETQHTLDQLSNSLASVEVNGTKYFALEPSFVSGVMCGRFSNTMILAMGCGGATLTSLVKSFLVKGASAFVGWDRVVTVSHTDLVFQSLVKLLLEGKPVAQSAQDVMTALGPDPLTGAKLASFTRGSLVIDPTPWYDQFWYMISVAIIIGLFGLAKVRSSSGKTARKAP